MAPPNRGRRAQRTAPTPPGTTTTTTATYFINPSTWDGLLRTHTTPTVLPNGEKPAKKFSTKVIFTSFSMLQVSVNLHNFRFRLLALHIQNLWNRWIHKYDPTISRIFLNPFLADFFNLAQFYTTTQWYVVLINNTIHYCSHVVALSTTDTTAMASVVCNERNEMQRTNVMTAWSSS